MPSATHVPKRNSRIVCRWHRGLIHRRAPSCSGRRVRRSRCSSHRILGHFASRVSSSLNDLNVNRAIASFVWSRHFRLDPPKSSRPKIARVIRSRARPLPGLPFYGTGNLRPRVFQSSKVAAPCPHLIASLPGASKRKLELMETGKVRTGEDTGAGWIDTTAISIQRARARLAELKSLLTESGAATVSKPDAGS